MQIKRALISVSDKTGVVEFAQALVRMGAEIVSTGGTAKVLQQAGVPVREVSELTGFPEIMDGRVKTLHPAVHAGILARRGVDDAVLKEHGIGPIDLVCVNLYPFRETVARGASVAEAVEQIDIGGPAMVRAAAKNHAHVLVVVDPEDYPQVIAALEEGRADLSFRQALAAKAFAHTASYDAAIARFLSQHPEQGAPRDWPDFFPLVLVRTGLELRYGENPHQKGAFYRDPEDPEPGIAEAELVQGKPLSYNNIADADAAYACVRDLPAAGCVIVKHMNPCGAAVGATPEEAYAKALACDPTSAFGGIVAFNAPVDRAAAERIIEIFTEIVIAPAFDEEALAVFAQRKNLRVLRLPHAEPIRTGFEMRRVCGGMLVQARDAGMPDLASAEQVGARAPSADELRDLTLAWAVVKHARSNAIVIAKDGATVGIGAGLTSRVLAARLAVEQAGERAEGAVAASDAFFPFRDGVDVLARAGVVAIAQPGGSVRDEEVIAAAREHGIAMLLTRRRAFRH